MSMLSKRALGVLKIMVEEGEEFVADGLSCWVGDEQTSRSVLRPLLRCMAVSDVSDVKGIERYAANATGRQILQRPELAVEVFAALLQGRPFQIEDGVVVLVDGPRPSMR